MKPHPELVKAKKREIAVRYASDLRNRKSERTGGAMATLRVAEIDRLLVSRYGAQLPDDDAGLDDARIMVHHLAQISGDARKRIAAWIALRAPWMSPAHQGHLTAAAISKPLRWCADTAAKEFGLLDVDRTRLRIKTIRAIDVTKAEMTKRRKQQAQARKAKQRREAGAILRKQYEAAAVGHGNPWLAAGVSRATWYRRQRLTVTQ